MKHPKTQSFTYEEFMALCQKLAAENRTTGNNQSEEYLNFSKLNLSRMNRLNKTLKLKETIIEQVKKSPKQHWLVITEAWCGDSAQNLPYLAKMAEVSEGNIQLEIILRDENPLWIDDYLTNGGRSIPKLISFDESQNELFTWGPRPISAQKMMNLWRKNQDKSFHEFEKELHLWYTNNKGEELTIEISQLLINK